MKPIRVLQGLFLIVLVLAPGSLLAATDPAPAELEGWFVEPGVGINWLDQTEGTPHVDAGPHLSLILGRRFSRRVSLELHTGYLHNHRPAGEVQVTPFITHIYDEDNLTQVPVVVAFDLMFPNTSRFEPHAGAGFGIVYGKDKDSSGGDGAFLFVVGVRYRLDPKKELGLSYRFIEHVAASLIAEEAVGDDTLNLSMRFSL